MKVYVATFYEWDDDYKVHRLMNSDWKKVFDTEEKAVKWLNLRIKQFIPEWYEGSPEPVGYEEEILVYDNKNEVVPQDKIDEWLPSQFVPHKVTYDIREYEVQ